MPSPWSAVQSNLFLPRPDGTWSGQTAPRLWLFSRQRNTQKTNILTNIPQLMALKKMTDMRQESKGSYQYILYTVWTNVLLVIVTSAVLELKLGCHIHIHYQWTVCLHVRTGWKMSFLISHAKCEVWLLSSVHKQLKNDPVLRLFSCLHCFMNMCAPSLN